MTANNTETSSKKIVNSRAWRYFRLKTTRLIRKFLPKQVKQVYIKKLHRELWLDASWNINYIVFTISACIIATFGLISNSTAVIIGAMLVAPLMLPLRALAFAALEGDFSLFRKAFLSIVGATIVALFLSSLTGHLIDITDFGSEVLSRTQPNLVDLGIAVVAGGISAFAKVRKEVSDAVAGTAIAVALMPPLCVVGLSLSQSQLYFAKGAFLLYLTNLLGITLSCMVVFIIAGYTEPNHTLGWTFALTSILVLPLGASFLQLVRQSQLTTEITNKLLNETITVGEGVNSNKIEVDWTKNPPIIYINLQTDKEITTNQAALVEEFIQEKMNQPFDVVFIVSKVTRITSETQPNPKVINKKSELNLIKSNQDTQTGNELPSTTTNQIPTLPSNISPALDKPEQHSIIDN
ncbi:MAG: TIGR00341 family protein [Xenococcaceae cyanobacterium MO_207.B15]|nr:TIGR00341 family protein [Xenococcaceae cyanobacterium MO_207.B15]